MGYQSTITADDLNIPPENVAKVREELAKIDYTDMVEFDDDGNFLNNYEDAKWYNTEKWAAVLQENGATGTAFFDGEDGEGWGYEFGRSTGVVLYSKEWKRGGSMTPAELRNI